MTLDSILLRSILCYGHNIPLVFFYDSHRRPIEERLAHAYRHPPLPRPETRMFVLLVMEYLFVTAVGESIQLLAPTQFLLL
jgi:hypothetical protein